ncbi:hypothetical protein [Actinoplanes regularis]|uniref:hypothetical protein n=1 Tax=Actinoplanes regularis TaxID=52697 RepID=UPI000B7708E7|nr:hypothetical protein [Actinoplanes regularis]GIE83615.1 hypothetical protein Are01nite_00950 [Actinoplanes regularis]
MTGNTPQPGETPEGNPWARTDPPPSWWQGDTDRDPTSRDWADRAAERARAAGSADTAEQQNPEQPKTPGHDERLTTAGEMMIIEPGRLGSPDRPDDEPEADELDADELDADELETGEAEADDRAYGTSGPAPVVLEIRIPPRPGDRDRPIVVDHRLPPLPEGGVSPATADRLERMENSPFWKADEARITAEARRDRHLARRPRQPITNPVASMLALVGLSLVASFFAWVSAEPFWLATGHGDPGYATTTRCHGDGLTQRCTGRFAAADGRFTVGRVTLLGITGSGREPGTISGARMVNASSTQAYAAPSGLLPHLRWVLGFLLVLVCGYGIAGATGARQLESRRARRAALLGSVAGPVLLLLGFLIAAY